MENNGRSVLEKVIRKDLSEEVTFVLKRRSKTCEFYQGGRKTINDKGPETNCVVWLEISHMANVGGTERIR